MIREFAYDAADFLDEDLMFFCEETECNPSHPVTTGYEDVVSIVEGKLDAASIEALVLEYFK